MWWLVLISALRTYYIYILKCSDGSYYTGVTNNVYFRVEQHRLGTDPKSYTYSRRLVELVYVDATDDIGGAIFREKQIKGWSRKKKEALIRHQDSLLPQLSKRYTPQKPDYIPKCKYGSLSGSRTSP
jgi:putative endonuclease